MNIYLLRDPNTKEVKYIGKTKKELVKRLVGHLHAIYSSRTKQFLCKDTWILNLLKNNQIPLIELIEEVSEDISSSREKYWVEFYEKKNHIFNIAFSSVNIIERTDLRVVVFQYSIDGLFLKKWDCIYDVEKELNIPSGNIVKSCKGDRKLGGKYMWRYYKVDKLNAYSKDVARKSVYSYDFEGNFVKEYASARDTESDGFSYKNVSQCCTGEKKSHKLHQWSFDKVDKIQAYQSKFTYKINEQLNLKI